MKQGCSDCLKHPVQFVEYLIVPESQNPVSHFLQFIGTVFVVWNMIHMLAAIQLNDEISFKTDEIYDVWSYHLLAAELVAVESVGPQLVPQCSFGIGGLAA